MNKRQKEVQQEFLNNEKAVLKKLEAHYEDALDEINSKIELLMARQDADMQHVIYQVEYQKALKTQVKAILEQLQTNEFETVSEYLSKAYEDGFLGTMYDLQGQGIPLVFPIDQRQVVAAVQHETKLSQNLYTTLGKDITDLQKKIAGEITRGIAGGQMYSEIARNVSNWARIPRNNAMRIARTEAHRIQSKATADAQFKAKEKGADVVKQWDSSLDKRTRKSHRELDGQIRELEEPFEVNGHKAMHPGGFGVAKEDINCRCAILQRARWNLGSDYTKWSADAPIVVDDDGTTQFTIIEAKNYESFKKQYTQATERVREDVQMRNDEEAQARIRERRAAWKARQQAQEVQKARKAIPDFDSMQHSDIVKWANDNLHTHIDNASGVNKEFYRETVKALSKLEEKMGGTTIDGLSVKFGGVTGNAYAKYDDKSKTVLLKKTGSLGAFEEAQKAENARYRAKWHTEENYHATTSYEGTVLHELGHVVDIDTGQALSRRLSNDPELFVSSTKISVYAGSSQGVRVTPRSEAWAENFAAYMAGGSNANDVPEEIQEMIEDYFKKKKLENIGKSSTIELEDILIQKSVGAKTRNYDVLDPNTGEIFHFAEGTKIQNAQVFAGSGTKKSLHEGVAEGLSEQLGGSPEKWQHCKGDGVLDYHGEERAAEVHWFQEETVGKAKFKVKEWKDEG